MIARITTLVSGFRDLWKFDNTWQLVLNRLFFRSCGPTIYRSKGSFIVVDHNNDDQSGTRNCLTTDMYSRYYDSLPSGKPINVMDLGANGGGLPLSLHLEGFTFERLLCVEMNPATYGRLYFNVSQNIMGNHVKPLNAAVWNENGEVSIHLGKGGTSDSLHQEQQGGGVVERKVPTRTFDSLVEEVFGDETIDFCKMDVEGAEFEALLSGSAARFKQVKLFLVEIHPHARHRSQELVAWLQQKGFAIVGELPQNQDQCWVSLWRNSEAG